MVWCADAVTGGRAVVVDIDGVVADASWRQHLLDAAGRRDWDAFFDAAADDPPLREAIDAVARLDIATRVVLVTGRPARLAAVTVAWLARHEVRWDLLVLRRSGDRAPAARFKVRVLGALRRAGFDVVAAFDDDGSVLEAYRRHGLTEVAVAPPIDEEKPFK